MKSNLIASGACLLAIFLTAFLQNAANAGEGTSYEIPTAQAMITLQAVNTYRDSYVQLLDLEKARRRVFCEVVSDKCSTREVMQDISILSLLDYDTCSESVRRQENLSEDTQCLADNAYVERKNKILRDIRGQGASEVSVDALVTAAQKKEDAWLRLQAVDVFNLF